MSVNVAIDQLKCQGHARCTLLAPDVFDVDDLGKGYVIVDEVPEELMADAQEAVFSCPEGAISVRE